jgi:hypothetical protein
MAETISIEKLIFLINKLVSNFDPTPSLVQNEFPLRWESKVFISDYDFSENYLELEESYECSNGDFLKSIGSAVVLDKGVDGSYEFWDGIYMIESHTWCSKLNINEDYPSLSLINEKFSTQKELIAFLLETYG